MVEFPEKIWAIEKGYPSRYRVSCSVLEHGPDEATEYVRADLYAALEVQLAEARKALESLDRMNRGLDWCDHDEQARRWSAARRAKAQEIGR